VREIVLNDSNPSAVTDPASIKTEKKIYDDLKLKAGGELREEAIAEVQSVVTENEQTCRICL
jgi:hypothetical protein